MKTPSRRAVAVAIAVMTVAAGTLWLMRESARREVAVGGLSDAEASPDWPAALARREAQLRVEVDEGDYRMALVELSRLYHANGRPASAARCYQALAALEPGEGRWPHLLAGILAGSGRLELALPWSERAVELAPEYLPAWLRLGEIRGKSDRAEAAATAFEEALRRDPGNPYARVGLARLDLAAERWGEAIGLLEEATRLSSQRAGVDLLVTAYERAGEAAKADVWRGQRKALNAHNEIPDPWLLDAYEASVDPYALALAAGQAERGGDAERALRLLSRAVALAPEAAYLRLQQGLIWQGVGDLHRAAESYSRAVEADPEFADGWSYWSAALRQMGDAAGADAALARGLEVCPESPGLLLDDARRLRAAGRYDEALAQLARAFRARPEEADPLVETALIRLRQGRVDEALAALREALRVEPAHPLALSTLALHSIVSGERAAARVWLDRAAAQPRVPRADLADLERKFAQRFEGKR